MAEKVKKTVKAKVLWALVNFPDLRDDKRAICRKIWEKELEKHFSSFIGKPVESLSAKAFMEHLINGKLSSPETILRWWRKIQAEYPALRGKEYNHRHNVEEPLARETFRHEK